MIRVLSSNGHQHPEDQALEDPWQMRRAKRKQMTWKSGREKRPANASLGKINYPVIPYLAADSHPCFNNSSELDVV
jgi:hypothetical protein